MRRIRTATWRACWPARQARSAWLTAIARHGLRVDALNAWGNPLHPDPDLAREHDRACATPSGWPRCSAWTGWWRMAGCPGGTAGRPGAAFRGRRLAALPGGRLRAAVGAADRAVLVRAGRVRRRRASRPAGLPGAAPGHLRVQRRDVRAGWPSSGPPRRATSTPATSSGWAWTGTGWPRRSATGSGTSTARTPSSTPENLALNGLLDRRWPEPAAEMPWTFAVPGRGHDLAWWTGLVEALGGPRRGSSSIEHEDPFVPATPASPRPRGCCARRSDAAGSSA